jgi:hypothetical protein
MIAPVAITTVAMSTALRFVIRAPHRTARHTDLTGGEGLASRETTLSTRP